MPKSKGKKCGLKKSQATKASMKFLIPKLVALFVCCVGSIGGSHQANARDTIEVTSPDGLVMATVSLNAQSELTYEVQWKENIFIESSSLGITVDDIDFGKAVTHFTRADGELEIQVDLFQKDRFLTLASTDGGGKIAVDGFDRVVLVDPTLELAESETTKQGEKTTKQGEKTVSPLVKTRWN